MSEDKKVIFSMTGVSKSFISNNKQVLKDIYLSFFYGAKIGIIGLNGSGKSTLLKIIAGIDKSYQGDVIFSKGYSSKKIINKVSFDKELFKKELQKSVRWVGKNELIHLKIWALATFSQYKNIILEVFDQIA